MNIISKVIMPCSLAVVFFGCSGHTLQTYANKEFNHSQPNSSSPTNNKALLALSPGVKSKAGVTATSPSQNKALNAVSPLSSTTKGENPMQKALNSWIKKSWTPIIDKNATIKKMDENKSRPFKLQEYVNKIDYYLAHKPKQKGPSNVQKLDKLPVIGN